MLHSNMDMDEQIKLARAELDKYLTPQQQQFVIPGIVGIILIIALGIVFVNNPGAPIANVAAKSLPTAIVNRQLVPTQAAAPTKQPTPTQEVQAAPLVTGGTEDTSQIGRGMPNEDTPNEDTPAIIATDEPAVAPALVPTKAPPTVEPTWTAAQLEEAAKNSNASAEQQDLDNMLSGLSPDEQSKLVKAAEDNIRKTLSPVPAQHTP